MKTLILMTIFLPTLAFSQKYHFERFSEARLTAGGIYGACFETFTSNGKEYRESVSKEKCKPSKLKTQWVDVNGYPGCFKVGENGWIERAPEVSECRPSKVKYKFEKVRFAQAMNDGPGGMGTCYEIDAEKGEAGYKASTDASKCRPGKVTKKWAKHLGYNGCFEEGEGGWISMLPKSECKPDATTFVFSPFQDIRLIFDKDRPAGECFEVDVETKGSKYKNSVDASKCKPGKVTYQWKKIRSLEGCFEIGGEEWVKSVDSSKCRPKETEYLFVREKDPRMIGAGYFGNCIEVDKETKGQKFKVGADMEKCRPPHVTYRMKDVLGSGRFECFEVDERDKEALEDSSAQEDQLLSLSDKLLSWFNSEDKKHVEKKDIAANMWIARVDTENCKDPVISDRSSIKKDGRSSASEDSSDSNGNATNQ